MDKIQRYQKSVRIGSFISEFHNVLHTFYVSDSAKRKAIRIMIRKIYEEAYHDGEIGRFREL